MKPAVKMPDRIETMGLMATISPYLRFVSRTRMGMLAHHIMQAPVPRLSDIPSSLTGLEPQLKTFEIVMPVKGIVKSVHYRYRRGFDIHRIQENPYTVIIFQCQETGVYDTLTIPLYHTKHRVYGYKYVHEPIVAKLRQGIAITKGTVFARSTSVKEGNIFSNSLRCNVVNLADPAVIEDGYGVSESFCQRGALLEMSSHVGSWGAKMYPLNLYGNENEYKPHPDIGECIREDGLVFAFREYSDNYDAIEMTDIALRTVDMIHDIRVYGPPGAMVYDIVAESGIMESKSKRVCPLSMTNQTDRHVKSSNTFYNGIVEVHNDIMRDNKSSQISPRLIQLFTRALAEQPNSEAVRSKRSAGIIRRTYKKIPIDEYRVELKCRRWVPLAMGSKMTGFYGDKGVICRIIPDDKMPYDKAGNRADVIKFLKASIARLIFGPFYEQFIGAVSRDTRASIINNLGNTSKLEIWDRLMRYYQVASPFQYNLLLENYTTVEQKEAHVQAVIDDFLYLIIPPDSPHIKPSILGEILAVEQPVYDTIMYYDYSKQSDKKRNTGSQTPLTDKKENGKWVETVDKCLIGVQQFIILEKSDLHPMSVSSGVLQHHGLIASANKSSRHSHPSKVQGPKIFSETDLRADANTMGAITMAKYMIMANSPEAHKEVVSALMHSANPTRIPTMLNLNYGTSRPLLLVGNILSGFGLEIVHDE